MQGFLHQGLAFGAALAAVPLIIHLLNRQRHRPLQWAAMRFVLAAYKKTRRRAQLENLLLLLLRMGVIALLAFALARPFTSTDGALASLTEQRRDLILIVDGSASTGYRKNVDTVYERIVGRARDILLELKTDRGDRVRLVHAADSAKLLSWRSAEEALAILPTLSSPTDGELRLSEVLAEVRRIAEEDAATSGAAAVEIRFLTDLQRTTFAPSAEGGELASELTDALFDQLAGLEELGLQILIEDLHGGGFLPPNLGVTQIRPLGEVLGPNLALELGVEIANYGANLQAGVRVALSIDGERQPTQSLEVAAQSTAEATFPIAFKSPGFHIIEASLEGDGLDIDDRRHELIYVPPSVRVLLVNGAPGDRIEDDEVGFLRAVLDPLPEAGSIGAEFTPFETEVQAPESIGSDQVDLAKHDVVVLANVESVSSRAVEALEEFVSRGGALLITVGDRVIAENYNARLWRPDGSGLLPAELERRVSARSQRGSYYRAAVFEEMHPALVFFADDRWKPLFTEVPIYEFLAAAPLEGSRVLASLDDDGNHPLLIERDYDRGRVLLWTTTVDRAWTRLPDSPRTLVPLMHDLLRYAGRPDVAPRNTKLGLAMHLEVPQFPRQLSLVKPDGSTRSLDGDPEELPSGKWLLPATQPVDQVGLWKVELGARSSDSKTAAAFAVQFPPQEGDMERIPPTELAGVHPVWLPLDPELESSDREQTSQPRSGELWRGFARLCLAFLILESLWGAWIGRRRTVQ